MCVSESGGDLFAEIAIPLTCTWSTEMVAIEWGKLQHSGHDASASFGCELFWVSSIRAKLVGDPYEISSIPRATWVPPPSKASKGPHKKRPKKASVAAPAAKASKVAPAAKPKPGGAAADGDVEAVEAEDAVSDEEGGGDAAPGEGDDDDAAAAALLYGEDAELEADHVVDALWLELKKSGAVTEDEMEDEGAGGDAAPLSVPVPEAIPPSGRVPPEALRCYLNANDIAAEVLGTRLHLQHKLMDFAVKYTTAAQRKRGELVTS